MSLVSKSFISAILNLNLSLKFLDLLYREFVQLLVNIEASSYLRNFLGDGCLVGVRKKDSEGRYGVIDIDIRPISLGIF